MRSYISALKVAVPAVVFALLLVWILPAPVLLSAQIEERIETVDIAELEYPTTCLFSIGWEQGDLFSTLIAPDGTRYPEDVPVKGITIAKQEGITIFRVEQAQIGLWRVEIKGNASGELAILCQKITAPLCVGEITAKQTEDNISVVIPITGEPGECTYEVSLALNGQTSAERVLASGTTNTGESLTLTIPAKDVSTWPEYTINVHAEMNRNGFTDFNDASSSVFPFTNSQSSDPVSGAKATFLDSRAVLLTWPAPEGITDEWLGVVLADHKIITSATASGDSVSLTIPLPESLTGAFSIQLSRMQEGIAGLPAEFTFDGVPTFEGISGIFLPEEILINESALAMSFHTKGPVIMSAYNKNAPDEKPSEFKIAGDGTCSIPLQEGQNRLVLTVIDENDVSASTEIRLVSDTKAPVLRIMQDWDGVETAVNELRFSGNADRGAAVEVNGQTQEIDSLGNFSEVVALEQGENTITVSAADKAGNEVRYQANVIRADKEKGSDIPLWLLWIVIPAAVLLIGTGAAFFLFRRNRKKARNVPKTTALCLMLSFLFVAQPACSTIKVRAEDGSNGINPDGIEMEYKKSDAVYMDGVIEAADLYLDSLPMEALELLGLVLRNSPDDVQALLTLSRIRLGMGDMPAAIDGYQELISRYDEGLGPVPEEEIDLMKKWMEADASARPSILNTWQENLDSVWDELSESLPEVDVVTDSDYVMNKEADLVNSLLDLSDSALSGDIDADELLDKIEELENRLGNRTDSSALAIMDSISRLKVLSDTAPDAWIFESGIITDSLASGLSENNPDIHWDENKEENTDGHMAGFETEAPEETAEPDESEPDKTENPDESNPDGTTGSAVESSDETTESSVDSQGLAEGLDGTQIRSDLTGLLNICALEMTTPGRIRMFVTVAEGSGGYTGGTPQTTDFEFRTNLGFRYLLDQYQVSEVDNVEKYTILLIDRRPEVSAENLALEKEAAAAFINSMAEGEKALVISGGIPNVYRYAVPSDSVQLFGSMEMETFLPTSDKAVLLEAVNSDYGGDSFDNPDIVHMLSYPLSVMTAISPVEGDWNTFSLNQATPRFAQIIAFTDGHSGAELTAGGPKGIAFLRGAAITANAAIHIVSVGTSADDDYLAGLAAAGRGSYIKASRDSVMDFYSFVRTRGVRVFLAETQIPGNPTEDFFELWCRRTTDNTYAGFMHNPGAGIDLVGNAQYSDAELGPELFQDFAGDITDGGTGPTGDPFETEETGDDGTGTDNTGDQDTGTDNTGNDNTGNDGSDTEDSGNETTSGDGTGTADGAEITIGTLDRHTIARGNTGLVMIRLSGEGFEDLTPQQVRLYIPELNRYISKDYLMIATDTEIRFYLSSSMAAGTYSLNVVIGSASKSFPNTFYVYDAASAASISFGPYTLTGTGLARGDSDNTWNMASAAINGYIRFNGETQIDGDWLFGTPDDLTLTPSENAYVIFDPESEDFFVNAFYLDDGDTMPLGYLEPFDLHRDGSGTEWVEQPASGGYIPQGVNFGFINIPFNLSTLYPDRIEMPVIDLDLDLPLQEYFLNKTGGINFTTALNSTITVRADALDLAFQASIGAADKLVNVKLFGGMDVKKLEIDIDTSLSKVGLDAEVELVSGEEISAHLVFKGWLPDELGLTVGVSVPIIKVPPSPIDVNLTELGGGVEGLAAVLEDPSEILGMTVIGNAKFTSGDINMLIPFLSPILDFAGEPPPLLATDNTEFRLRPWPFSLSFGTDLKLLDAFQMGHAELAIGYYQFEQDLLGISDEEAVGLHAMLSIGPDIDLKFIRIGYTSGPSLDINNHGLFISATGGAWAGINLGFTSFTADFTGTFLTAVHDIDGSSYPQLSIVLYAVPNASVVGLWDTDTQLDIRLLINENGVNLIGVPSPLSATLDWMEDQASAAAEETWDAVTEGMDELGDLADETWELAEDGADFVEDTGEAVQDAITDGAGEIADTAEEVFEFADDIIPDPPTASGVGSAITGAWHALW